MSDLTTLEENILAYFLAEHAADFTMADRWYPYGGLVETWVDKLQIATRKFGFKVKGKVKPAAAALVDTLIEKGAYSTKPNEYGGSMHNFKLDTYRATIKELKATNPIIAEAEAVGTDFWQTRFAELTA
jgi:hypothetical protein